AAATVAAGPAATSPADAGLRAAAALVGVALAVGAGRLLARRVALVVAVACGTAALAAQVLA
ncbi:MAG: hypothetical protein ACR2H3_06635, partial [Acidimicrobiales bacterium]